MNLIIVESPSKAKTISKFLGKDYLVKSSYGHVRDLPVKELGIDVKNDFEPKYVILSKAKQNVADLKKSAAKAENIILATDEDREGEAIAWHLISALGLDTKKPSSRKPATAIERIVFHEITKKAIENALKNPRKIDLNLVDAQQTRRILDRLVGYKLSPLLWKKIAKGLSAGRVQSVAVRLIVEREREIQNFKTDEYWTIIASLGSEKQKEPFEAVLFKIGQEIIPKLGIKTKGEGDTILKNLEYAKYQVIEITQKKVHRNPSPPFVTSTLQQEASKKLGFSPKQTMLIAQQLYEGIDFDPSDEDHSTSGLITYMRTDSTNLADEAVTEIRKNILKNFGEKYLPDLPLLYKTKSKGAQEAHEAIRPTDINREPENLKKYLDARQYKLYNLIWRRTMACQMKPAVFDSTTALISAIGQDKKDYIFKATGSTIKFDGFLKVYSGKITENILPPLDRNEFLQLFKLLANQHFTEPPARYSEAGLIKDLEEYGIGRPSTYAPTLATIQDRKYVERNMDKKLQPTEMGILVNDLLVANFPEIVDYQFTAKMEENLDNIAEGKEKMLPVIKEFYEPFEKNLKAKEKEIQKVVEVTDKICPQCGKQLVVRYGRNGKFFACPGFPECRYTESLPKEEKFIGLKCPKCDTGEILERKTRKGKIFYGCNQYPKCDYATWDKPIDQKCPKCGGLLTETKSKKIKCPACDKATKYEKNTNIRKK